MLPNMRMPQPSIKVIVLQKLIFLHPPASPDTPANDPILCGEVILTLPKVTSVKYLGVKLTGSFDLHLHDGTRKSGKTLTKELILDECVGGRLLDKGHHRFAFSIVIPSSTAPFERCRYGRVYHTVSCSAKFGGVVGTTAEDETGLELVVNPAGEGELMPCDVRVEGFNDELGPYAVSLLSQHLTIGGLLDFTISFPSVCAPFNIESFEVYLAQSYEVRTPKDPERLLEVPWHKYSMLQIILKNSTLNEDSAMDPYPDQPLPSSVSEGESFSMTRTARIPDHHHTRASTLSATTSVLSISHNIVVEMTFRHPSMDRPAKVFKAKSPVTISSCRVMPESLTLPSYSSKHPTLHTNEDPSPVCMCGFTMDGLLSQRGEGAKVEVEATNTHPVKTTHVHNG